MEKLTVKNFLVIKHAEFDVGRMNFIIGPQASGKSVLAKLLYFFREFLMTGFQQSAVVSNDRDAVIQLGLDAFERIFPSYAWREKDFSATYLTNGFEVCLINKDGAINLKYADELERYRQVLVNTVRAQQLGPDGGLFSPAAHVHLASKWMQAVVEDDTDIGSCFRFSLFIPAGRSFFANLQRNVFTFLENNIAIDHLVKAFGARLELTKKNLDDFQESSHGDARSEVQEKAFTLAQSIFMGKYLHEDDQDWIVDGTTKTNLAHASSGQQESLPMLLVLIFWTVALDFSNGTTSFVEEPEANLFPTSQKRVLELFAYLHNKLNQDYVITTHSPYILTAVNNLTLAKDVRDANPGVEIENMPDPDLHIAYEDVRAYTIEDGVLLSIMDDENRLIGASVIDEVSNDLSEVFDSLLLQQIEM